MNLFNVYKIADSELEAQIVPQQSITTTTEWENIKSNHECYEPRNIRKNHN